MPKCGGEQYEGMVNAKSERSRRGKAEDGFWSWMEAWWLEAKVAQLWTPGAAAA